MKFLWNAKDGGPESRVWCWGFEFKRAFSVLLLKFESGSREAFHTHAFNAWSWVLSGALYELTDVSEYLFGQAYKAHYYPASFRLIRTPRERFHRVFGLGASTWVLTFRGPWRDKWLERTEKDGTYTLTHGRKRVG